MRTFLNPMISSSTINGFVISVLLVLSGCNTISTTGSGVLLADQTCDWQTVSNVYDGDTIKIGGGWRIRYLGIDTPEMNLTPPDPLAMTAKERNEQLVGNKKVCLQKDSASDNEDKYGRLLRYVILENGNSVQSILLSEGLARVMTEFPFQAKEEYLAIQESAVGAQMGIWKTAEPPPVSSNQGPTPSVSINPAQAKDYLNKSVTITYLVRSTFDTGKAVSLNSEADSKSPTNFVTLLYAASKKKFKAAGIADPAIDYLMKTITVTGTVKLYQGKFQIVVNGPEQIVTEATM